jgi:peptidoglycan LD-endopeptidase LytH
MAHFAQSAGRRLRRPGWQRRSSRPDVIGVRATLAAGAVMVAAVIGCSGHAPPETKPAPAGAAAALAPVEATVGGGMDEPTYLRLRMLMVPVSGVRPEQIPDTYLESRSGGRTHRALDILAARGTPVLSADDGRVLRLRRNTLGGITIYAIDAGDRFVYYYAHLDHYAATLAEGETVAKGQVIGYVGTTGNAPANTPHLHFQLMRRPNAARWWDGAPIDPKPYLVLPGRAKDRG